MEAKRGMLDASMMSVSDLPGTRRSALQHSIGHAPSCINAFRCGTIARINYFGISALVCHFVELLLIAL